jgi:hypothetical protein
MEYRFRVGRLNAGRGFAVFENRERSPECIDHNHSDHQYHLSDFGLLPAQHSGRHGVTTDRYKRCDVRFVPKADIGSSGSKSCQALF